MPENRKKLGELLIEAQLITPEQLEAALTHQSKWGGRIGTAFIASGSLTEEQLLSFLRDRFQLPSVNLKKTPISDECLNMVPGKVAKRYKLIPVGIRKTQGKDCLIIAMSDPTNFQAIDEVTFLCGLPIQPALAPDAVIEQAISHYYDKTGSFLDEHSITYEQVSTPYVPSTAAARPPSASIPLPTQAKVLPKSSDGQAGKPSSDIDEIRAELRAIASLLIAKGVINEKELRDLKEVMQS